jgi:hypothetical protein
MAGDAAGMRSRQTTTARGNGPVTKQAQRAADKTKRESQGLVKDILSARESLLQRGVSPGTIALQCGLASLTFGFLFQITHNVGFLPVYDVWAFNLGPFPEAWTIPIALAPIWLLYGYVAPILDEYVNDGATREAQENAADPAFTAVCWGALAAQFLFSDLLYQIGTPHWLCSASLAVMAAAIWRKFDNTSQGAVLAGLLTVGAPLGEVIIVNVLHLWHYARPDFFGVPHWAGWCYATYALGVANAARLLQARQEKY